MKKIDKNSKSAILEAMNIKGSRTVMALSRKKSSKPEISGRTNATNPKSLTDLATTYQAWRDAEKVSELRHPVQPRENVIPIEHHYKVLGALADTCPYELKALLESEPESDNQLISSAMKKLVAAIKLSTEVNLGEVRRDLKRNDDRNVVAQKNWRASCENVDRQNEERSKKIAEKNREFYAAWGAILIDLVQKTDRNPELSSLGAWDRYMCYALTNTGKMGEFAEVRNDRIRIFFQNAKAMLPSDIASLPDIARRYQEREEEARYAEWLDTAPITELQNALWESKDEHEREHISHAIAARKGFAAVRNRYGEIQWVDKSYNFDEDSDDTYEWIDKRAIREAFIDYLNNSRPDTF